MSPKRLFLFDIDGTLLNSGGAGGAAMRAAFTRLYGVEDGFKGVEFSGRSDLAIIHDALLAAGVEPGAMKAAMSRFRRMYYRCLPELLTSRGGRLLPGVQDLLTTLKADAGATLALGTGNFRRSAGLKLRHFGIDEYFVCGGFGDRTGHRPTLVAQGIRAANRIAGKHGTVFVIGDTVHDVTAAKANGAIAVAVATGIASIAELEAAGADLALPSLENALEAMLALPAPH